MTQGFVYGYRGRKNTEKGWRSIKNTKTRAAGKERESYDSGSGGRRALPLKMSRATGDMGTN